MPEAAAKQSWGQISELVFMALMPLFFVRLGVKKMLALGMLAWGVRYLFFELFYTVCVMISSLLRARFTPTGLRVSALKVPRKDLSRLRPTASGCL
jgi:hypothetical protein